MLCDKLSDAVRIELKKSYCAQYSIDSIALCKILPSQRRKCNCAAIKELMTILL